MNTDALNTTGTALTAPWPTELKVVFGKPDGAEAIIARVRSEAMEQVKGLTVTARKDRDAIASAAYQVAKRKAALDAAGKALNDDLRVSINAVDAERRKIRDELETVQAEVRAPLTKWEADDKARVDALQSRLERVRLAQDTLSENPTAEQVTALLSRIEAVAIDDTWGEFTVDAAKAKDATITTLRIWRTAAIQREADTAELARLRAEAEARAEDDRHRIAAEQAEAARIAAEKAESDRLARIEREAQEREARAAAEAEARAKAEAVRVAKETADRESALVQAAKDADARRARELVDAKAREELAARQAAADNRATEERAAKAIAEAKSSADRAAQDERDRIAAQVTAEAVARAKREADTAHRGAIKASISAALKSMSGAATPDAIADALMAGKIPHCRVDM